MKYHESTGFVLPDGNGLSFSDYGDGRFVMAGEIRCLGGIVVDVLKELEVVDGDPRDPRVKTVSYSYNASIRGLGNVVRYDGPDGHRLYHHAHRYDVFAIPKDEAGRVERIENDKHPTIGELLEELTDFYGANIEKLPKDVP